MWLDLAKNVINYGKDFFSYSKYLDEFSVILHSKNEFPQCLTEDDVLNIDGELNVFFVQNIGIPIISDLKENYEYCKNILKATVADDKKDCIERKKTKLYRKLENAKYLNDNERIKDIEEKMDTVVFCENHGLETHFYDCVIMPMDFYINEIRKNNF